MEVESEQNGAYMTPCVYKECIDILKSISEFICEWVRERRNVLMHVYECV